MGNRLGSPEQDSPSDFNDAATFTTFVDLTVAEGGVHDTSWFFARPPRTTFDGWWLGGAVDGGQRRKIGRQLVTGEQEGLPIRPGLEISQKRHSFRFTPLMTEMTHDPQSAGQSDGTPDPHIPQVGGVIWLQVFLLFLTNVHSSSTCAWVKCRLRIR